MSSEHKAPEFFSLDSNNLGCGGVLIILFSIPLALIIIGFFATISSCDSSKTPSQSTTQSVEQDSSAWMDENDPITWRAKEEQLERGNGLSNAKYACQRCGMKSHYPLDDGVNGTDGICAYCVNYLNRKSK